MKKEKIALKEFDFKKFGFEIFKDYLQKSTEIFEYINSKYTKEAFIERFTQYLLKINKAQNGDTDFKMDEDEQYFAWYLHGEIFQEAVLDKNYGQLVDLIKTFYILTSIKETRAGFSELKKFILSTNAKNAVDRKLEKDPKQIALRDIEAQYKVNKSQFKRRGYSAQFARDMQTQYPVITDIKTIEKLVAKLNKGNELIPR